MLKYIYLLCIANILIKINFRQYLKLIFYRNHENKLSFDENKLSYRENKLSFYYISPYNTVRYDVRKISK
nr:MAG TPA: hypothetical protein [Caudoviricetes sp.]